MQSTSFTGNAGFAVKLLYPNDLVDKTNRKGSLKKSVRDENVQLSCLPKVACHEEQSGRWCLRLHLLVLMAAFDVANR